MADSPGLAQTLSRLGEQAAAVRNAGGRVAVVGLGSELHSDDCAGVLAAQEIEKSKLSGVRCFIGGCAPENITGELIRYAPQLIIFVDAADIGGAAGEVRLIAPEEIVGMTFSTHTLPLHLVVTYLAQSLQCEFAVVGIQPHSIAFGDSVAAPVLQAVEAVVREVCGRRITVKVGQLKV